MSQFQSNRFESPEMHTMLDILRNMGLGQESDHLPDTTSQPISGFNMTLKDLLVLLEAIGINVPLVSSTGKGHKLNPEQGRLPRPSVRPDADTDSGKMAQISSSSANGEDIATDTVGSSPSLSESGNIETADIDEYDPGKTIRGFVCAQCKAYNLVRPSKESCYAVTAGLEVGVFTDWLLVKPLVVGVSKACYKRYGSLEDAHAAFNLAERRGDVKVLPRM